MVSPKSAPPMCASGVLETLKTFAFIGGSGFTSSLLFLFSLLLFPQASDAWGISCMRYEIRDIRMQARVQEAMQMQVEAERKKRAAILESEGIRAAEVNVAEGKKQAKILQSEAEKQELINQAHGAAEAVIAAGKARLEHFYAQVAPLKRSLQYLSFITEPSPSSLWPQLWASRTGRTLPRWRWRRSTWAPSRSSPGPTTRSSSPPTPATSPPWWPRP